MIHFIDNESRSFLKSSSSARRYTPTVLVVSLRPVDIANHKLAVVSSRALRDATVVEHIDEVHTEHFGVYGIRKMWHALRREGIDSGREPTAGLRRLARVSGTGKAGISPVTTRTPKNPDLCPDVVNRHFKASAPGRLWVADVTYVRTRKGFVYTACVTEVFSRRIVGWALSDSMRTSGVAAAGSEPGDCVCEGNDWSDSPLVIMAVSTSALLTTSGVLSTELLHRPGRLVIPMTMRWPRTSMVRATMSVSIPERGTMLLTWRPRRVNGSLGGMRPESTRVSVIARLLRLSQSFGKPTRPRK